MEFQITILRNPLVPYISTWLKRVTFFSGVEILQRVTNGYVHNNHKIVEKY